MSITELEEKLAAAQGTRGGKDGQGARHERYSIYQRASKIMFRAFGVHWKVAIGREKSEKKSQAQHLKEKNAHIMVSLASFTIQEKIMKSC